MSELTQNFIVQPNDINISVDTNNITLSPTDINMGIYLGGVAVPGGANTQLQYNNNNQFDGVPGVTYANGNLTLGNAANVKIGGGTNGYILQTDGTGNISWSASGGSGNGVVGGSNTQIQFNNVGLFGGVSNFTFNTTGNLMSVPNANIGGTLINSVGIQVPGSFGDITGANLISCQTLTTAGGITASGNVSTSDLLLNTGNGIGYGAGTSAVVTQTISRTNGVTLNKTNGSIILFTTTLAGNTQQQFTLTNSYIEATDMLIIQHVNGGTMGLYNVTATINSPGSALISIRNNSSATSGSQTPVLKFALFKAA